MLLYDYYIEVQQWIGEDCPAVYSAEKKWQVTRRDRLQGRDFPPYITKMSPNRHDMWVSQQDGKFADMIRGARCRPLPPRTHPWIVPGPATRYLLEGDEAGQWQRFGS